MKKALNNVQRQYHNYSITKEQFIRAAQVLGFTVTETKSDIIIEG